MPSDGEVSRRQFGRQAAAWSAAAGIGLGAQAASDDASAAEEDAPGAIRGEPTAEKVGLAVLADGGNAVDAAVAGALAAAVAAPHQTGIGGYGGHLVLTVPGSARIVAIDFNSAAPAAARDDMYPLDDQGRVVGRVNLYGWRAAGVPGILAGLAHAVERYGTRPLRAALEPAIALARDGFPLGSAAAAVRGAAAQLKTDPGSRALYFRDGQPLKATATYTNPDLARMLERLAADNSVAAFYRGDIGRQIAAAFQANGGLVTSEDMAAYRALEIEPIAGTWGEWTIHTAPLTAGGATVLQALRILQRLGFADRDPAAADTAQMQVEALRYAWQDRLQFLGDPQGGPSPVEKLLAPENVQHAADQVERAVSQRRPLPVRTTTRPDQGTIHLSACDSQGNLVAVTLTHGGAFGARVTVPGLGLTLGHGMSRFEPQAGHPNAPGPGKRPLNNMCPMILAYRGRPVIALGGRGGRRIPNAAAEVLLQLLARGRSLAEAVAAPRLHTEGTLAVSFEKAWPEPQLAALRERGYTVSTGGTATISAVALTDRPGAPQTAMR